MELYVSQYLLSGFSCVTSIDSQQEYASNTYKAGSHGRIVSCLLLDISKLVACQSYLMHQQIFLVQVRYTQKF